LLNFTSQHTRWRVPFECEKGREFQGWIQKSAAEGGIDDLICGWRRIGIRRKRGRLCGHRMAKGVSGGIEKMIDVMRQGHFDDLRRR
jgi:hypothetical protein